MSVDKKAYTEPVWNWIKKGNTLRFVRMVEATRSKKRSVRQVDIMASNRPLRPPGKT